MRMKFVLAIILMAIGLNAQASDPIVTGSWYNPDRDGEGISLEVDVGYFYTYGIRGQSWYVLQKVTPDKFIMWRPANLNEAAANVGTATVDVIDNDTIIFSYRLALDLDKRGLAFPHCLGGHCSGVYEYIRQTHLMECE